MKRSGIGNPVLSSLALFLLIRPHDEQREFAVLLEQTLSQSFKTFPCWFNHCITYFVLHTTGLYLAFFDVYARPHVVGQHGGSNIQAEMPIVKCIGRLIWANIEIYYGQKMWRNKRFTKTPYMPVTLSECPGSSSWFIYPTQLSFLHCFDTLHLSISSSFRSTITQLGSIDRTYQTRLQSLYASLHLLRVA